MRINIIKPKYLSDIHLRAEYREILMAPYFYWKSLNSKNGIQRNKISKRYTLNKGHAYMWYNKLLYLKKRYDLIEKEMIKRGFKIRPRTKRIDINFVSMKDVNDYTPDVEDVNINVNRLLKRIMTAYKNNKGYIYKYYGKDKPYTFWQDLYKRNNWEELL